MSISQGIYAIGGWNGHQESNVVTFKDKSQPWQTCTSMSHSRNGAAAVVCSGKLITVGGCDWNTTHKSAEMFDGNRWKKFPDMLHSRSWFGMQVLGDEKIFALGGHDQTQGIWHQTVEMFENDSWTLYPLQLENPLRSFGITSWENTIIFGGGSTTHHSVSKGVYQFDPRQPNLNILAPLPTSKMHVQMVSVLDDIYCIGGYDETYSHEVLKMDVRENLWVQVASMQIPRSAPGAVLCNEKIVVVGGTSSHAHVTSTIEEYDPSADTWTYGDSLPGPRSGLAVVAL